MPVVTREGPPYDASPAPPPFDSPNTAANKRRSITANSSLRNSRPSRGRPPLSLSTYLNLAFSSSLPLFSSVVDVNGFAVRDPSSRQGCSSPRGRRAEKSCPDWKRARLGDGISRDRHRDAHVSRANNKLATCVRLKFRDDRRTPYVIELGSEAERRAVILELQFDDPPTARWGDPVFHNDDESFRTSEMSRTVRSAPTAARNLSLSRSSPVAGLSCFDAERATRGVADCIFTRGNDTRQGKLSICVFIAISRICLLMKPDCRYHLRALS